MPSPSDMQNFPSTKNQSIFFLIKKKHVWLYWTEILLHTLTPTPKPFFLFLEATQSICWHLVQFLIHIPFNFFHLKWV